MYSVRRSVCSWRWWFGIASRYVAAKRKSPDFHIKKLEKAQEIVSFSVANIKSRSFYSSSDVGWSHTPNIGCRRFCTLRGKQGNAPITFKGNNALRDGFQLNIETSNYTLQRIIYR